jgi:hypothetical protein
VVWGRVSLPSHATELTQEAAEWWAKVGMGIGFIREKVKATAREVQQSPETGSSLLRWRLGFLWVSQLWVRWVFLIDHGFAAFLRWTGLVCTFIGDGETILRAFCSSALWQIYQILYHSLGCRNAVYNPLSSMKECRTPTPQDAGVIWLSRGMGCSLICLRSPDPIRS